LNLLIKITKCNIIVLIPFYILYILTKSCINPYPANVEKMVGF